MRWLVNGKLALGERGRVGPTGASAFIQALSESLAGLLACHARTLQLPQSDLLRLKSRNETAQSVDICLGHAKRLAYR